MRLRPAAAFVPRSMAACAAWRPRRLRPASAAAALLLPMLLGPGAGDAAAERDPRVEAGFELIYNLDYEKAIAAFQEVIAAHPDDPVAYRSVAAAAWLQILYLRGGSLSDNYLSGSGGDRDGEPEDPPEALAALFTEHLERATALAEAAVENRPDDPDAHYELGVAAALDASYRASVQQQRLGALRAARRAYAAHERVLELDPDCHDAKMLVGLYRYIVSILPRAFRWMAYLFGFDGGKDEALALVSDAAAYGEEVQAEAQFVLVLLHTREEEYASAIALLRDLRRAYPRNRLIWLESASTWLRDDRPAMAELALAHGFALLQGDDRPRMSGEAPVWYLKRGTARGALGLADAARIDLERAARGMAPPWVGGRAHLELGKLDDLDGRRQLARRHYTWSSQLCGQAGDGACERTARRFRDRPYTGPDPRP